MAIKKVENVENTTSMMVMASGNLPSYIDTTNNEGNEGVTAEDLTVPRLELVQALSPCRKKTDPTYIEGAEEGHMYNSITRELYAGPVLFVPIFFQRSYLVWKDRKSGGGFNGSFPTPELAQRRIKEAVAAKEGQESEYTVSDTGQHFILVFHPDGRTEEMALSLARTKLKVSRHLNTLVRLNGGPRYSRVYQISTAVATSAKGEYYNYIIKAVGFPNEFLYNKAKATYDSIMGGFVKVDQNYEADTEVDADSEM